MSETLYEKGREELAKLLDYFENNKGNRNEATTRFQLIDSILLNSLAWERGSITSEDSYNKEFTDYTLHLNQPVLIIEAKREGNYFELPSGYNGLNYPLKSLCKDEKNLRDALVQVSQYCQKRGIQLGAVSNGWQFVVFLANRVDGIPPLEGNAYVFPSLDFIYQNFKVFWNCLSPAGLQERFVFKKLVGGAIPELPPKLSTRITHYPGVKDRNPFQTEIQIISELVLEDIIRDREVEKSFLQECYCKSGALSQYALISKEILKTRYEYLFEKEEKRASLEAVVSKKGLSTDFSEVIANSMSRRPVLLLGDVGVGKSTFINNLIKVEAESIFENALTFKIDLGSQAVLSQDIRKTVIDEMYNQLDRDYGVNIEDDGFVRGTYDSELQKLRKGIYKKYFESDDPKSLEVEIRFLEKKLDDHASHLKNSLLHLSKARQKQIIIFIDNCDQRDDETQQTSFLIAQEFAEHWPATVFLTLRPETFHRSMKRGALSGYHPKAFTISPPRIDEVIEKRLLFAQKITRGEIPLRNINITTTFSKLDSLLQVLLISFKNNIHIIEFVDNLVYGNVRQAIELAKNFLGSGHVDTNKIIKTFDDSGSYIIPLHEFLRAVIYGDTNHYDPQTSPIVNLFDVQSHDKREHFLLSILLGILNSYISTRKNDGYLETSKVFSQLQEFEYTIEQIDLAINFSLVKKLIETSEKGSLIEPRKYPSMLRITTKGVYHSTHLIRLFTYIDAIIVDTPIFDSEYRAELKDTYHITDRLFRAKEFVAYLDKAWQSCSSVSRSFFDWDDISHSIRKDIDVIKTKI